MKIYLDSVIIRKLSENIRYVSEIKYISEINIYQKKYILYITEIKNIKTIRKISYYTHRTSKNFKSAYYQISASI